MPRCKECKDKFEAKKFLQKFCLQKPGCIQAAEEYKREQYEKAKIKASKRLSNSKVMQSTSKKKKSNRKPLNKVSAKNTYLCSDGTRLTQSQIDSRYLSTIKMIDQTREPVCESCGRGDRPLSHSHTISRKRAKELGKAELIFDENNIIIECYEERTSNPTCCHNKWEDGSIEQKKELLTWESKLAFIKEYDESGYLRIMQEI